MPLGKNVSKNIAELHKSNKKKHHGWSDEQIIAIALSAARDKDKKHGKRKRRTK